MTCDPAIADAQNGCDREAPPVPQRRILGAPMDSRDRLSILVPCDPWDGSCLPSASQTHNQQHRTAPNYQKGESGNGQAP